MRAALHFEDIGLGTVGEFMRSGAKVRRAPEYDVVLDEEFRINFFTREYVDYMVSKGLSCKTS